MAGLNAKLDFAKAPLLSRPDSREAVAAVQAAQAEFDAVTQAQVDGTRTAGYQKACTESQAWYDAMNPHKKGR